MQTIRWTGNPSRPYALVAVLIQRFVSVSLAALVTASLSTTVSSAEPSPVKTTYVRLGPRADALMYEPAAADRKSRVALIYTHTNANTFSHPTGPELAARGYRALMLNSHETEFDYEQFAAHIALAMKHLRSVPGVERVVFITHSGGGKIMAFYQNVAEHGPKVCDGREKIYACRGRDLVDLPRADGVILLDVTLGGFHRMSSVDPAVRYDQAQARTAALDMYNARNGYDSASGRATYPSIFIQQFFAAQATRHSALVSSALSRLRHIEAGHGAYKDDEPFVVEGMGVDANGARPYQPDVSLLSKTRAAHLLLKADGSASRHVITSVRPPLGMKPSEIGTLRAMAHQMTIREFLIDAGIRVTTGYHMSEDAITGVDWASSYTSVPSNVEGVTVPTLVMAMSCHYLLVPGEIVFEHAGANDKEFAVVEGATHGFRPCQPEYGDTQRRLFDYVDGWLSREGRF